MYGRNHSFGGPIHNIGRWDAGIGSLITVSAFVVTLCRAAYRIGVFVTGFVVALVGIALLVLPGPGWLLIFLGLAILATEFRWARRTLHWTKGRYQQTRDRVTRRRTDPLDRRSEPGSVG